MAYAEGEIFKDTLRGIFITSLLCLACLYIPVIGFLCALIIPLPVLFYSFKLGRRSGLKILGITIFIIICIVRSVPIDIVFFAQLLFLGFILGELLRIELSIDKTIGYACFSVIATGLISLFIFAGIHGSGIFTMLSEYVAINLKQSIEMYKQMGIPEENIRLLSDNLELVQYLFIRIIPSLVISSVLFLSWITLLIAKPLFAKTKIYYPDFGALNLWKAPEQLVWVVIGAFLMLLIPDTATRLFGVNILLVMMPIYFFQGIAIVSYYFVKKQLPKGLRVLLYSIIAFQYVAAMLITGLGFFDIWLNVRKIENPQKS